MAEKSHPKSAHAVYLILVGCVFIAVTLAFLILPRTTYSELEKRDLAEFPDPTKYQDNPAGLTADISQWFSDSEPYRDLIMTASMQIRNAIGFRPGKKEEQISFKPSADIPDTTETEERDTEEILEPAGNPLAEENAKISNSGTIVVGAGDNVRALMAFGGSPKAGAKFVTAANKYAEAFPDIKVYALVAPLATEFYLPEKGAKLSKPEKPVIDNIKDGLLPQVHYVDAYSHLAAHTDEDIYLRTDHHWAPRGAFYAARAFARTAGVPFRELDSYDEHTIKRFVGSMFGYTKDMAVKNAPEDFVYHTPKGLNYKSLFTTFHTDKNYNITSVSKPYESNFFRNFKDGSGNAYLTFMGSDQNLVKVETGSGQPRKLLIIKDSYGNALPGYLFYSFGEIHIIDFRYFPYNVKEYASKNGITDILLAFNIFNACNTSAMNKITAFLTKHEGEKEIHSNPATATKPVKQVENAVSLPPAQERLPAPEDKKTEEEPTKEKEEEEQPTATPPLPESE